MVIAARRSRTPSLLAGLGACLVAACAPSTPSAAPAPVQSVATDSVTRPRPYPVDESPGFRRAVTSGTRTRTGQPGPKYWQQWAHYTLAATYDSRHRAPHRHRHDSLLQSLATPVDHGVRAPARQSVRAGRGPERDRAAHRRSHRVARRGAWGDHRRGDRQGARLQGQQHRHVDPDDAGARRGRQRGPRVRLEPHGAAGRRAARRADRRPGLHQLLVSPDGGVRRRGRLAARPVHGQRRVLHGVRELRRGAHGARRLPHRRHRQPGECTPRCSRRRPCSGRGRRSPPTRWCTW